MKERPILFSAPMVRAILDGSKTQTRRVVKAKYLQFIENLLGGLLDGKWNQRPLPYGKPGDRLWVRETFIDLFGTGIEYADAEGKRKRFAYAADCPPGSYSDEARKDYGLKWKPSIHMPRWASRILLEIVSVRVERLHEISTEAIIAEGLSTHLREFDAECDLHEQWRQLWESINGPANYDANPWVWVVEFKKVES